MDNVGSGFGVLDVLFLVGLQSRTGELVMESGNNIGSILVHEGMILQAYSPYSRAMGDLLVDEGIITESELLEALAQQKKDMSMRLGTLLMKMGKVNFETIERLVHDQIRKAICDFESWENIHFSFIQKKLSPFDRIHMPVHEFIRPETIQTALSFIEKKQTARQSTQPSLP